MHGWKDEWNGGWVAGWLDGWEGEQMGGQMCRQMKENPRNHLLIVNIWIVMYSKF